MKPQRMSERLIADQGTGHYGSVRNRVGRIYSTVHVLTGGEEKGLQIGIRRSRAALACGNSTRLLHGSKLNGWHKD